ncbi:MAG: DUF2000 family protein [Anaerolineae bacterium]
MSSGVESVKFDTKIAVLLCDDLPTWQKLNMTAFLVSGIAATVEGVTGEPYEDASDKLYLPMFRQPVLVFAGTGEQIRRAYDRALAVDVQFSLFTEELFSTGHDEANRAAVKQFPSDQLKVVGMALRADRKLVDKIVQGLSLHK